LQNPISSKVGDSQNCLSENHDNILFNSIEVEIDRLFCLFVFLNLALSWGVGGWVERELPRHPTTPIPSPLTQKKFNLISAT
jgi:hypothetical protein